MSSQTLFYSLVAWCVTNIIIKELIYAKLSMSFQWVLPQSSIQTETLVSPGIPAKKVNICNRYIAVIFPTLARAFISFYAMLLEAGTHQHLWLALKLKSWVAGFFSHWHVLGSRQGMGSCLWIVEERSNTGSISYSGYKDPKGESGWNLCSQPFLEPCSHKVFLFNASKSLLQVKYYFKSNK